ncbi:MAG: tRNA threonylcarbamoyladenosine dehydratase [Oscillospiraceae bacterium]|nr:tRNA threonylcarbamoyladenosine dehydratase [Oscillospiraceae bacterium]
MREQDSRTVQLLGEERFSLLRSARVAVFGIGGVGGHAAEALVRAGVGYLEFIDGDTVSLSNLNRQAVALHSTLGINKAEVMARKAADINPDCKAVPRPLFFDENTAEQFDFSSYSYVVDAIDSVSSKLLLIEMCKAADVPIISSMGAGNRIDPTKFRVADIYRSEGCPLARVMRSKLRKRNIKSLNVVFSPEELRPENYSGTPGTLSYVPSSAGLILAGKVITDLTGLGERYGK